MVEATRETGIGFRRLAQRIRVPAGFVLAPLLFIAARPNWKWFVIGAVVAVIGLMIRAWASGYLKKNVELTTTGPYAHTRNPLYLGTFILGAGIATSSGAWWFIALFMALYLLIYVPVMMAEAETLGKLFAAQFPHYRQRVPLFLPRLTPYRAAEEARTTDGARRFAWSQYLKHREYRAALGVVIVYALLAVKFLLLSRAGL
jgi:protein-S-isoprenylcysteine O-methyltransferase Ste14